MLTRSECIPVESLEVTYLHDTKAIQTIPYGILVQNQTALVFGRTGFPPHGPQVGSAKVEDELKASILLL